jgi:hypothetical protein
MGIRIPKNQIITGKYTTGKEYVILSSHAPYQGYYYELNGRTFAGKEFNPKAPEIIRMTSGKFNPLLENPATATYAKISKIKLDNTEIRHYSSQIEVEQNEIITQYFARNITQNDPIIIRQIDRETFNKLQSNPLYQKTSIDCYTGTDFLYSKTDLDRAEKELPYIKTFLGFS